MSIALLTVRYLDLRDNRGIARTEGLLGSSREASSGSQYHSSYNGNYNTQVRGSPIEAASNQNLRVPRLDSSPNVANSGSGPQNLGQAPHQFESLNQFSPHAESPDWLGIIGDILNSPSLDQHSDLFPLQLNDVSQLCPAISRPRSGWLETSPSYEPICRMLEGTLDETRDWHEAWANDAIS